VAINELEGYDMSLHFPLYVFVLDHVNIIIIIKVEVTSCLTKHHAMNTYWQSGGIAPRIL
jgi:hypothetical protein